MQRIEHRIIKSREALCKIALSWIGTPYHHMGRIKGAGVDCAMFPLEVYREAGLIGDFEVPYYPHDWMLHRSEEIFLHIVERHAQEIKAPPATAAGSVQPGDFVIYKFGRCFAHGAIVIEWPLIVHAVVGRGVILSDAEREGTLLGRERKLFSICGLPEKSQSPRPRAIESAIMRAGPIGP